MSAPFAASRDGAMVVTTSPRGGVIVAWDVATRRVVETRAAPDACGAAAGLHGITVTTGEGRIITAAGAVHRTSMRWDNHLAGI